MSRVLSNTGLAREGLYHLRGTGCVRGRLLLELPVARRMGLHGHALRGGGAHLSSRLAGKSLLP